MYTRYYNMARGPFGGPRPFASDTKTVIVLVGVDGPEPPNDVLLSTEQVMQDTINDAFGLKHGTLNVSVTTNPNPTSEQKDAVGDRALHVEQYDIQTPWEEIAQDEVNMIHNEAVSELNNLGFNITGTRTTVV